MEEQIVTQKRPMDYLKIVFRRKWLIIIPTLIGIIGAQAAINFLPKSYQSSTLILVEEGKVINPLFQGLAVSTSVSARLNVLREQILGWDRINQLISKLNLSKNVTTQQDLEDLVAQLRKNIKVRLRGPNIFSISFEGKAPKESMDIVRTITDIFIAENLNQQNREADNAISFINDQLALYKKKLKQSEVVDLEEQLKTLLIDSTEKHPLVISARKKIAQLKKEMDEGDYEVEAQTVAGGSTTELNTMREELKKLREDISTSSLDASQGGENRAKLASATNEKLYKMLLLERIEKVASEDANVNQKLYNELLQRLETAKITQRLEASKDGTRYTILDPARLPLKASKPNKVYTFIIGMILGLFAGFGLVVGAEIFDHSFLGIDEARACLDMPVLGAISKIITESDLKLQRMRNARIAGLSVLTGVILVIMVVVNLLFTS